MPGARLTQVAARSPADRSVEEPRLLEVADAAPQPALHFAKEVRLLLALGPLEVIVPACEREVVPVDHALHVSAGAVEGAGTGLPPDKAEALQRL
eukprot:12412186-Alexandrium_andersonii.AAC.1